MCVIAPTGERDDKVDEDNSVVSDYMSDIGEEWDLHAATMLDVSLSEGVAVKQNLSQEGRRNRPAPYIYIYIYIYMRVCVCVCVYI